MNSQFLRSFSYPSQIRNIWKILTRVGWKLSYLPWGDTALVSKGSSKRDDLFPSFATPQGWETLHKLINVVKANVWKKEKQKQMYKKSVSGTESYSRWISYNKAKLLAFLGLMKCDQLHWNVLVPLEDPKTYPNWLFGIFLLRCWKSYRAVFPLPGSNPAQPDSIICSRTRRNEN